MSGDVIQGYTNRTQITLGTPTRKVIGTRITWENFINAEKLA